MKSRTSSFNPTVFKKDITRFAPCWGSYLILLLLVLTSIAGDSEAYWRLRNMPDAIVAMGWINLIYAAVVAQLIFGDLYHSRLCNALHAMPMTRGGWFVTHTASGLAFSVVPNLVIMLVALPMMRLGAGWTSLLWWLLASELQYLFFFGVAVLCVMLSGNRLGHLALYAMINFAGLGAWWLVSVIYEPLLYGVQFNGERFYPFSPVAEIGQLNEVLVLDFQRIQNELGEFSHYEIYGVTPGNGWGYMAIIALVGILALTAALVLYRKRRLECAGDFVAFKAMEPVVQVLVTLFAGGFFHLFGDVFGLRSKYVLIICGMIVGFFACRMMLMRTNRVFQKKGFLKCALIMAVFALTLALTAWDPAGITTYLPEMDEIESVTFSDSYSIHRHSECNYSVREPADIEAILGVHADCIDGDAKRIEELHPDSYSLMHIRLEYKLRNGKTVNRFYGVYPPSEAGQVLKGYFTRPECVLGFPAQKAPEMVDYIRSVYIEGSEHIHDLAQLDLEGMLNAIIADCEAGNMVQFSGYHLPQGRPVEAGEVLDDAITYLEIAWNREKLNGKTNAEDIVSYSSLRIYRSCANTLKWLETNGLLSEETKKEMVIDLGGPEAVFETKG